MKNIDDNKHYKPCYNHNVYTPIEKMRTAFQDDVIIP